MASKPLNNDLAFQMRRVVGNAYAFIRGRETTQSFSAITFEDLAAQQLERLTGNGTDTRPSVADGIKKIEDDLVSFAEQIKQTSPDDFLKKNEQKDVNTAP